MCDLNERLHTYSRRPLSVLFQNSLLPHGFQPTRTAMPSTPTQSSFLPTPQKPHAHYPSSHTQHPIPTPTRQTHASTAPIPPKTPCTLPFQPTHTLKTQATPTYYPTHTPETVVHTTLIAIPTYKITD